MVNTFRKYPKIYPAHAHWVFSKVPSGYFLNVSAGHLLGYFTKEINLYPQGFCRVNCRVYYKSDQNVPGGQVLGTLIQKPQ